MGYPGGPPPPPRNADAKWVADKLGLTFQGSNVTVGLIEGYEVQIWTHNSQYSSGPTAYVTVPGLPDGLVVQRERALLRRVAPTRRRYVTVGDPEWDNAFRVEAESRQHAEAYLTAERRSALMAAASGWWVTGGERVGLSVSSPKKRSEHVEGVRQAVEIAKILDPSRTVGHA